MVTAQLRACACVQPQGEGGGATRGAQRSASHRLLDILDKGLLVLGVQVLRVVVGRLLRAHVVDRPERSGGADWVCGAQVSREVGVVHSRIQVHVLFRIELLLLLALQDADELLNAGLHLRAGERRWIRGR